jgi:hypothetical protein
VGQREQYGTAHPTAEAFVCSGSALVPANANNAGARSARYSCVGFVLLGKPAPLQKA